MKNFSAWIVIHFFVLSLFFPIFSSSLNILSEKPSSLNSLDVKDIDYVAVSNIAEALSVNKFYNKANHKVEIIFDDVLLKFTANNNFVIATSKSANNKAVFQIFNSPILLNNEIYIPIEECTEMLSKSSGKQISFNKSEKSLVVGNSKIAVNTRTAEVAETTIPNEGKNETVEPEPEAVRSPINFVSDISNLSFDEKSNGTLIKISCRKDIPKLSYSVKDNIVFLNMVNFNIEPNISAVYKPKGEVLKTDVKKISQNTQLEFHLKQNHSTVEVMTDKANKEILISIHNNLLSKSSKKYNKQVERWNFDAVVIDAGHGGKDPGAIGVKGVREKDVNLGISLKLGEMIKKELPGVKVIYTRDNDKFVELNKRGKIANEEGGKLFISVHCNSLGSKKTKARGYEIYLLRPGRTKEAIAIAERENSVISYEDHPEQYQDLTDENFILVSMAHSSYMRYSEQFSDILNKEFYKGLKIPSRGVKQAGFYVLVGASMPSVLVEAGFLSNPSDEKYLASKKGQTEIAESLFNAVKKFKESYDEDLRAEL